MPKGKSETRYTRKDFKRLYKEITSLDMKDEKGNPLYTKSDLKHLAKTMIQLAHEVKRFGPGVILVPERGAVPIAKMLQITLYELGKRNPEFADLHPEYISFPNTAETKYAFDWYVLEKILGRKKFGQEEVEKMIQETKRKGRDATPLRNKNYKKLLQRLRQLKPNFKRIMLIDEMNTGVSFFVNYGLIYEKLRALARGKRLPHFEFRGVAIAHRYGSNVYTDHKRIRDSVIRILDFYDGRLKKLYRQRKHYMDKIREYESKIDKVKNKGKLAEIQKKMSDARDELNRIDSEIQLINDQKNEAYSNLGKLTTFFLNLDLKSLKKGLNRESLVEVGAHNLSNPEASGSIATIPTKSLVSMDVPKLLGETFVARGGKTPRFSGLNTKRTVVTTDIFWHPELAKHFKRFMLDYHNALKEILDKEKKQSTKRETKVPKSNHRR